MGLEFNVAFQASALYCHEGAVEFLVWDDYFSQFVSSSEFCYNVCLWYARGDGCSDKIELVVDHSMRYDWSRRDD